MWDHFKDKDEAEIWLAGDDDTSMLHDDLIHLAKVGFNKCKEDDCTTGDFCPSRKYCPDDACYCVRQIFPTPEHYDYYLKARAFYLNNLAFKTIALIMSKGTIV